VEKRTFPGQNGAGNGKRPNRRSPDNGIRFETSETPKPCWKADQTGGYSDYIFDAPEFSIHLEAASYL